MLTHQKTLNFDVFAEALSAKTSLDNVFYAPLLSNYVPAGLPTPIQDNTDEAMDLNEHCIQNPRSTYFVRASGDSMINAGIFDQDILVLDRSVRAKDGNIVVAALNGDLTVKVLRTTPSVTLEPRNDAFSKISVHDEDEFDIFGVVTYVIHSTT